MQSIHISLKAIGEAQHKVANSAYMADAFYRLLEDCKANVRAVKSLPFYPNGVTMCVIIAESHAVMSTWPESNDFQFDFFCCGNRSMAHDFLKSVVAMFTWATGTYIIINRDNMEPVSSGHFKNGRLGQPYELHTRRTMRVTV